MVTLVGQEILRGRHISVGGVTPRDWLHFIVSLLCHDIGYVRGICRGDADGSYVTSVAGDKVSVPEGATDASMTPYHVARSKAVCTRTFQQRLSSILTRRRSKPTLSTPASRFPRKSSTNPPTIFRAWYVQRI